MKLNLYVARALSEKLMLERIKIFDEAAVIIDERLHIIAKNRAAAKLLPDLRRNTRINRFLWEDDKEKIANMKKGQILQVCLVAKNQSYKASVICGEGYRVITFLPLYSPIHHSLNRIYEKSSGYDVNMQSPLPLGDGKIENTANAILSLLDINENSGENSIFSPSEMVRSISSGLYTSGMKINVSVIEEPGVIYGAKYDFAMIVAYLISFFADTSRGKNIEITHSALNNNSLVTVSGDTYLTRKEIEEILKDKSNSTEFSYWFRILNLLAEGNLWKFYYNFSQEGKLCFCLASPVEEQFEKCVLRDVDKEYINKILKFVFNKKIA